MLAVGPIYLCFYKQYSLLHVNIVHGIVQRVAHIWYIFSPSQFSGKRYIELLLIVVLIGTSSNLGTPSSLKYRLKIAA